MGCLVIQMSMKLLADHILSVAQKNNKSINNLKLQKVMYFVLKESRDKNILPYKTLRGFMTSHFLFGHTALMLKVNIKVLRFLDLHQLLVNLNTLKVYHHWII